GRGVGKSHSNDAVSGRNIADAETLRPVVEVLPVAGKQVLRQTSLRSRPWSGRGIWRGRWTWLRCRSWVRCGCGRWRWSRSAGARAIGCPGLSTAWSAIVGGWALILGPEVGRIVDAVEAGGIARSVN